MPDAQRILEQVREAFSGVPLPTAEALLNRHCCECLETSAAFAGKLWTDISLEDLLVGRETALLTATAWRYYLPAMITWCVRAPEAVDVLQDNLVSQLEPPSEEGGAVRGWFEPRASGFSDRQRQAIVGYLEWYLGRLEPEWSGYGGKPPAHVYRALAFWRR